MIHATKQWFQTARKKNSSSTISLNEIADNEYVFNEITATLIVPDGVYCLIRKKHVLFAVTR